MTVFAVITCFHPDTEAVTRTCAALQSCGITPVIVDNTETSYIERSLIPDCKLLVLGENRGIASAQNAGIRFAIAEDAAAVLFLDQDSEIDVVCLTALLSALRPNDAMLVGPRCVDSETGVEMPMIHVRRFGLPKAIYASSDERHLVDVLISSGTIATRKALMLAGPMDEDLFIDFVDTEWCLRCRSKGIAVEAVPSAELRHTIGARSERIGPFTVLVHNPVRCYYQLRNCLLLFRRKHIPTAFALHQTLAVFVSRLLLLLTVPNRLTYVRACMSGIIDGVRGVTGKRR